MTKTYVQTLNEALHRLMEEDSQVFIIGQGVTSPWYVGGLCNGLLEKFGEQRVIDTPISENAVTGAAVGAAIAGMKPILIFPRMDFMLYALDPIINAAAKWSYMFGGSASVPLVIWAIINRGGSQGAQHSQDLTWLFKRIPGLHVVRPWNAYEAQYYLKWAVRKPNPVVFVDNRELYQTPYKEELLFHSRFDQIGAWCPCPASEVLEEEYFKRFESPIY